jgi:Transglutaminase-like superfamily
MKRIILFSISIFTFIQLYSYTGEINKRFATPGQYCAGLTFDGENLWASDRMTDLLYCIRISTGEVRRTIKAPGYWPMGLAWDGKYLWNADIKGGIPLAENYNGKIYQIDPSDGTVMRTIQSPTPAPRGLAWDGKYLWTVDDYKDVIIQFDPKDGTTIKEFKSPSGKPQGLTFDGKYLWISDRGLDEIYMVDPSNGAVLLITKAPGNYSRGLSFDGEFLWNIDYQDDLIYQLKVNDGEKFKRDNEKKSRVTFTHQTTNFGPGKVKTLDFHFAMPNNRDNQEIIGDLIFEPKYTDIITDKWGQKTAHWHVENMAANTINEIKIKSEIKTYDVRYFVFPDKVGTIEDIPKEIKLKYLENNDKYQYDDPIIQKAVKKSVGNEKNPYWIARNIFNYLIDNMYYEMVGGWNTAPTVLGRGNGSCSEYSFVYIAMCRAAGLPARYVGSIVNRNDEASMDDVFHRWVEVYLPNYGWIPVDPSGGDHKWPRDQADSFGALVNRFYITTQSGGGSETMEWTYNSNEFYTTEPQTNVVIEYFGDWDPVMNENSKTENEKLMKCE